MLKEFKKVIIEHVPKFHKSDANRLAQHASGYRPMERIMASELIAGDWRKEIIDYLKDPSKKVNRKIRFQAIKVCIVGGRFILSDD